MKKFRKVIRWALVCLLLVAAMTLQVFATGSDTVSMPEEVKTLDAFVPGSNVDKFGATTVGAMPCVGNPRVLVFYTTFAGGDTSHNNVSATQVEQMFFGNNNSLRSFYKTSSYGKLDITGTVYEYTTLHEDSAYPELGILVDEIVQQYQGIINWSEYDSNGDGYVDGIYVISRTNGKYWASGALNFATTYITQAGEVQTCRACFSDADVITLAHETCHMFGPVDLYANTGVNPDGPMMDCLMESGTEGNTIADLPGVTKYVLGWMDKTQFISGTGTFEVTLSPASTSGSMAVILPNGDPNSPYWFVVEYITKEGNHKDNVFMPYYSGIRVWRTEMNLDALHNIKGSTEFCAGLPATPYLYIEAVHPGDERNYYLQAGDSITPYTDPSTAYGKSYIVEGGDKYIDELAYSGISIQVNSTRSFEARLTIQIDNTAAGAPVGTAVFTPGGTTSDYINDNSRLHIGTLQADYDLNVSTGLCIEDPVTGVTVPVEAQRSADGKGLRLYVPAEHLQQLQENKAYHLNLTDAVKTSWGGALTMENFDGTVSFSRIPCPMENISSYSEIPYPGILDYNYHYFKVDDNLVLAFRYRNNIMKQYVIDTVNHTASQRELEIRHPNKNAIWLEEVIPMKRNCYLAIFHGSQTTRIVYFALYDENGNFLDDFIPENRISYMGLHDSPVFLDEAQNVHLEFYVEGNMLKTRQLPGLKDTINMTAFHKNYYKIKDGVFAAVIDTGVQALVQIMDGQTGQLLYAQTANIGNWGGKVDIVSHAGKLYILTASDSLELTTLDSNFSLIRQEMILPEHYVRYPQKVWLGFADSGYWVWLGGYNSKDTDFVYTTYLVTFGWDGTVDNYYHHGDASMRWGATGNYYSAEVVYLQDDLFLLGTEDRGHMYVHNNGVTSKHTHRLTSTKMPGDGFWQSYMLHQCTCGYSRMDQFQDASGHIWAEATCTTPKTCSHCGLTAGQPLGHSWDVPDCTVSRTCGVCGISLGASDHTYSHEYDYKCDGCGMERIVDMTRPMWNMYRMYDPNSGEHFYTGSDEERDNLVAVGWHYEGIGFTFPLTTGLPVYRLYDPVYGEHLYTMDPAEKELLMSLGWQYEGIAFNSAYENEVPQYRLHNPNETRGAYHFTASIEERDYLLSLGWEYQGIGWYSMGA